jgi:hypothetical protein
MREEKRTLQQKLREASLSHMNLKCLPRNGLRVGRKTTGNASESTVSRIPSIVEHAYSEPGDALPLIWWLLEGAGEVRNRSEQEGWGVCV